MGFATQSPDLFAPFVAVVLPAVFLLGILVVVRLVDTALENNQYLAGSPVFGAATTARSPQRGVLLRARGRETADADYAPTLGLASIFALLGTTASMMIAFIIYSVVAGVGIACWSMPLWAKTTWLLD